MTGGQPSCGRLRRAPATPREPATSPAGRADRSGERRHARADRLAGADDDAAVDDRVDLLRRAVELVVGEDGRAFEGQVARDLQPRLAGMEVVADLDGYRTRDAVRAQQQHVQRMPALPLQALLAVVRRPDVVRRERVDGPGIVDRPVRRHLGPGADAYAIGLWDAPVARQRMGRRLGVGPHALLERAAQLGLMGGAHDVVALVLEGRIQEEALVLELELLALLADGALAHGDQLLAFGKRAD